MVSGDPLKVERELADELRLHPRRPPVTRLSRKVLVGLAAVAIIAVLGAVMWALEGRRSSKQETGSELYNTEHKTTADELAKLPRDYSGLPPGVPPLGPPLPGDFGRANVQQHGPQGVDPEQQRVAQETEAARTSRLFAPSTTVNRARYRLYQQRQRQAEHSMSRAKSRRSMPTRSRTCRIASSHSSTDRSTNVP
jgi:type IV secretion system protein TrbI